MPPKACGKSNSGIYHLMLRGINPQNIFEDNQMASTKFDEYTIKI